MKNTKKNWLKYAVVFIASLLFRLIPFRAPNIEIILATQMPFSKIYGRIASFSFGFFGIIFYDILTKTLGMWTLITASAYGFLGLWAYFYFKNKNNSSWNYIKFAIMGTLFFDTITGFSVGPLIFHQTFMNALVGQIPFTLLHLLGNVSFAFILSPGIYNFAVQKKKKERLTSINTLNPRII